MKDEALKLALEALENTTPTGFNMERDKQFFAAITALREALAEQPAQQEPVAIADGTFNHNCPVGTPLYTSPPAQRKPLTDDEIESINVRLAGKRDLSRLFARAIEAAHGIKENT